MTVTTRPKPLTKHPPPSGCVLIPDVQIAVTVPMEPAPETGPNGGYAWKARWRAKNALKAATHFATRDVVMDAKTDTPFQPNTRLSLYLTIGWSKGRKRMDEDNAIACCKAAIDGFAQTIGVNDKHFTIAGVDQCRDSEGLGWVRITAEVID